MSPQKQKFVMCFCQLGGLHPSQTIEGQTKARMGRDNGNCKRDPEDCHTWQPLDVSFEAFGEMLARLHDGRLRGHVRPWLRRAHLPASVSGARDADRVIQLMNDTTFGHPDRYLDAVSLEILAAMTSASSSEGAEEVAFCMSNVFPLELATQTF